MHTLLVIGGYGFFGARICRVLAGNPAIRLLISGRSHEASLRMTRELGLTDDQALRVDTADPRLSALFKDRGVETVLHTAGPFQGQDYSVARAAIEAGCHYIDLADGRQFVNGIGILDAAARERGLTVTSGASTVPALSCAVIDRYSGEFARLESVRMGLSSAAKVPGPATVRGVFAYAGKPVRVLNNGAWTTAHGWGEIERHEFPAPVGRRWVGTCDVPDLDLLPRRYPGIRTATFKAGFASDAAHLCVWLLAGLVRTGVARSLAPLAGSLSRMSTWLKPFISDKGGMFVILEGSGRDGQTRRITWSLIAEHNEGPFIPCGASIVLANKLAAGVGLPRGAMPCAGLLNVDEYLEVLKGLAVREVIG
jgi:saccharopine dehydrogenase-like NADP-dependent oxidoreductase